ncbi:ABC transporter permease [Dulcicalothrix desertica PCC 7102]|uniref:ABC transporter permease n=1 Tax=Dulcicalothrix desertica PCC 7102 TaxID=232991 RepID=A0A3S1ICD0_9CYAN|nr:ABC-2 family transporter protein [Dulcicalothrix desertica]RUS95296.1 ABC transporter permease [Dulcicalothrix desertica PCC 7102]TWH43984.1 ABC-2 type transport system permease protein [Dulcicalothrix desertica PCC 7102]
MKRYLKFLQIFVANSLKLETEYRVQFVLSALNSLVILSAGFIVIQVMFNHTKSVGGWSFYETLAILGVFMIIESFINCVVEPNLTQIPTDIHTGYMDFNLLKPVNGQFLVSFYRINIWSILDLFLGVGVLSYSMIILGTANIKNFLLSLMLLFSGAVIIYSVWFLLSITSFWFVKVSQISEIFLTFFSAGRFPASAYPRWARLFLTFIVPIVFATTVPASAAVGRLDWKMALGSLLLAGIFLLLSNLAWRIAVANYTSASS